MLCLSCVQMLTQFKPMNHQFFCHAAKPVVFGCSLQSLPIFKKQLDPSTSTTPAYLLFAALSEAVPQLGRDSPCLGSRHHPAFSASSACSCSSFRRFSSKLKRNCEPNICHLYASVTLLYEIESDVKLLSPSGRDVNVPGQRLFLPLLFL